MTLSTTHSLSSLAAYAASKLKEMDDKVFYATFGLTRDFTPDEEADVRASNKWVEDA